MKSKSTTSTPITPTQDAPVIPWRWRRLGRTALVTLTLFSLGACVTGPSPHDTGREAQNLSQRAQSLVAQGRLREAANEYLRLAGESSGALSQVLNLEAASLLVETGDTERARRIASTIPDTPGNPEIRYRKALVAGALDLADGAPTNALDSLPPEFVSGVPPSLLGRGQALRARAYEGVGLPLEGARSRSLADSLITNYDQQSANQRAIWADLAAVPRPALAVRAAEESAGSAFGGWIRLSLAWRDNASNPTSLSSALQDWAAQHPGHPANGEFLLALAQESVQLVAAPGKVALLLPFDGPFEQAAIAIRDGFTAAWLTDAANPERPDFEVLDTASEAIRKVYDRAVAGGAEFVVGPVRKPAVAELHESGGLTVPTLLLNNLPEREASLLPIASGVPPPGDASARTVGLSGARTSPRAPLGENGLGTAPAYQYSLSPEDEARQVARRAWFDGRARAAVIAPKGAWGERVANAFTAALQELGGVVVATEFYPADTRDLSPSVRRLLNINRGQERVRTTSGMAAPNVNQAPRDLGNPQMIFLAAFPPQARQLRPALRYLQAGDIPIYSTSHVYSGTPRPRADRSLDGVAFGHMPWVLAPSAGGVDPAQMRTLWPAQFDSLAPLYAFGADAYALVSRVGQLRVQAADEYPGLTGGLRVAVNNKVIRNLTWARFDQGVPRLLVAQQSPVPVSRPQ